MKSTKTSRKLNVRLLRRIKRHILEEPRRFLMSCSLIKEAEWKFARLNYANDLSSSPPPCGTAACIAGWADILTGGDGSGGVELIDRAADVLGVTTSRFWAEHTLFSVHAWPEPYRTQYFKAEIPSRRAKIAAARIEHLIATGE